MIQVTQFNRLPAFLLMLCFAFPCCIPMHATETKELADTAAINEKIEELFSIAKSETDRAFKLSTEVIEASEKLNYPQGIFSGNYSLGHLLKRSGRLDSAKMTLKKCIKLIEENPDIKYTSSVYILLANIYASQSMYDSAIVVDKKALEFAIKKGDTTNYIICSNNMSIAYRYLGMWDSSLAVLKENERLIRLKRDTVRLGTCLHLQAIILQNQGQVKTALETYFTALSILKQTKSLAPYYLVQVDLATLYIELKEYRKAISLLNSIKEGYDREVQTNNTLYNTLGKAYQGIENFDSAFYYYQESVEECLSMNRPGQAAIAYRFLGDLLNQQGKYDEASGYLQKSLEICDQREMKQHYAITSNSLGASLLNLGKLPNAIKHFTNAMNTGYELNDYSILRDAANGLQQVHARNRNFEAAYHYFQQYKQYNDSLLNAENIRLIAIKDLEYEFNNEKNDFMQQQKEERLLHQESLKRQKLIRNTIILFFILFILLSVFIYRSYLIKKKANDEKAALMKEIHHRVKNNLQIISSLLSIQTESVTDANVIGAVKESQSRVKAMALIHQLLYQNDDIKRIDFNSYLTQLTHILSSIFKKKDQKVNVTVNAEAITFDIDLAIPLGLIITELVSNAFKYAFTEIAKGQILIRILSLGEKEYRLTVSDNGKGLSGDINFDTLETMGLRLVKILTDQLNGKIRYSNNKGSIFNLEFALRQ